MRRSRRAAASARLRRGIYLLPSVFTVGNIFLGFLALMKGFAREFDVAALLVIGAGILDTLDGRIARLTHTESDFGREFDSLADVLTFGMVPALLAYSWGLADLGRLGWLSPFFYVVCAATRLARFNVQTASTDGRYFTGLPTPAAAGSIVALLYFAPDAEWRSSMLLVMLALLPLVGCLMVSTFRYPSFKRVDLRRRWSFRVLVPIAAVVAVAAIHPHAFFLAAAALYTCAGPTSWLVAKLARHPDGTATAEVEPRP